MQTNSGYIGKNYIIENPRRAFLATLYLVIAHGSQISRTCHISLRLPFESYTACAIGGSVPFTTSSLPLQTVGIPLVTPLTSLPQL